MTDTRFKPGNPGGGRPKGSKNRLSEDFVSSLADDFSLHGKAAIEATRGSDPATYLKIIASVLPKDVNITQSPLDDMSRDELSRLADVLDRAIDEARSEGSGAEAVLATIAVQGRA